MCRLENLLLLILVIVVTGCAQPVRQNIGNEHITGVVSTPHDNQGVAQDIPSLARSPLSVSLPPPRPIPPMERYTVVVYDAPVRTLLFALAQDLALNLDLHPNLSGNVTLNAIEQPLPAILDRIAAQLPVRWQLTDNVLRVTPDTPFLRQYTVDYPNIQRDTSHTISIATQITAPGGTDNISQTTIEGTTNHRFWSELTRNIEAIVSSTQTSPESVTTDAALSDSSGLQALSAVTAHPETGTLLVRATAQQHAQVQEFLDRTLRSARRQVLLEATIVEVELSDDFQQGIRWDFLREKNSFFRFESLPGGTSSALPGGTPPSGIVPSMGRIEFLRPFGSNLLDFSLQLLQSFGTTKVLSSPKLSVLNNQTALLKVVESRVYFTLTATFQPGSDSTPGTWVVTSTPNTVPVGFLMAVTPQISAHGEVILNLRPTISRLVGYVRDPAVAVNLAIARGSGGIGSLPEVESRVPEIQTREIESVIRVRDGEIAVLGGLMRDEVRDGEDGIPGASRLPVIGDLFKFRNNQSRKTELIIFLRPRVIDDPSLQTGYRDFAQNLPSPDFLTQEIQNPALFSGGHAR